MKLRAKFTFLFIGLVVSMGLVIAFITFNWQRRAIEEQMRERGAGICRTLAVTAAEADLPPLIVPLVKLESTERWPRGKVPGSLRHYAALFDCTLSAILQ